VTCTYDLDVAKTGRTLDMVDLAGRTAKVQRRSRTVRWIGTVLAVAAAVITAAFAVTGALKLVTDQGDQSAYDNAPYCQGVTNATENCVLRTDASVVFVDVSKNTGKSAHGYTTSAFLDPQIGGQEDWVVLSSSKDLSGSVTEGDTVPVLVWRDQITRFTFAGHTHDSDANPHHVVAGDLAEVTLCLIAATVFGRPRIRRALRSRIAINLQRNRIPDWTLMGLVPATAVAALLRASYAVIGFGLAGVAVLVLSAAWPFVPWVATPSMTARPYVVGSRAAARTARKRNQTRPGRLP
jgi:hypothetical protein